MTFSSGPKAGDFTLGFIAGGTEFDGFAEDDEIAQMTSPVYLATPTGQTSETVTNQTINIRPGERPALSCSTLTSSIPSSMSKRRHRAGGLTGRSVRCRIDDFAAASAASITLRLSQTESGGNASEADEGEAPA